MAGHSGCGKTSLCDLMLYKAKAVDRLGSVDAKTSVSDFTPDEQEKHSSIYTAYMSCEWNGFRFFFSDTPGYGPFIGEVIPAYRASGAALVVMDGANGLEIGAARAFKLGKSFDIPKLAFINRLDRDDADFFRAVGQLQEAYGKNVCVPMTLPVGKGAKFERVVSVLGDP
ncbi:MAG TPA: elongation factor G, partial [Lentisphaeria bacterium]|nr:elongation factor G [Lentisphaeria bacterium]